MILETLRSIGEWCLIKKKHRSGPVKMKVRTRSLSETQGQMIPSALLFSRVNKTTLWFPFPACPRDRDTIGNKIVHIHSKFCLITIVLKIIQNCKNSSSFWFCTAQDQKMIKTLCGWLLSWSLLRCYIASQGLPLDGSPVDRRGCLNYSKNAAGLCVSTRMQFKQRIK